MSGNVPVARNNAGNFARCMSVFKEMLSYPGNYGLVQLRPALNTAMFVHNLRFLNSQPRQIDLGYNQEGC